VKGRWLHVGFASLAATAVVLQGQGYRAALPDESWSKERLAQEMSRLGYRSEWVDAHKYPLSRTQGLYLARPQDPRTWAEIAAGRAKRDAEQHWRGLVVVDRLPGIHQPREPQGGLQIGPFTFFGDPEEIARIARHFGAN
jgi:hypothetical protein